MAWKFRSWSPHMLNKGAVDFGHSFSHLSWWNQLWIFPISPMSRSIIRFDLDGTQNFGWLWNEFHILMGDVPNLKFELTDMVCFNAHLFQIWCETIFVLPSHPVLTHIFQFKTLKIKKLILAKFFWFWFQSAAIAKLKTLSTSL